MTVILSPAGAKNLSRSKRIKVLRSFARHMDQWRAQDDNMKQGYVYLLTNAFHSVLYTGVTSDLFKRVWEHREKQADGFTKKYNGSKLVYYEVFDSIRDALTREKQIKGWVRKKKMDLIRSMNPAWSDLYDRLLGDPSSALQASSG